MKRVLLVSILVAILLVGCGPLSLYRVIGGGDGIYILQLCNSTTSQLTRATTDTKLDVGDCVAMEIDGAPVKVDCGICK